MASNDNTPIVQAVAVSEIRGADATPLLEAIPRRSRRVQPLRARRRPSPRTSDERRTPRTRALVETAPATRSAAPMTSENGRPKREWALIADGNRHARVGNQYDARRTPQYREDAAYARKVAQEESEDVGDRDRGLRGPGPPYKVGLIE